MTHTTPNLIADDGWYVHQESPDSSTCTWLCDEPLHEYWEFPQDALIWIELSTQPGREAIAFEFDAGSYVRREGEKWGHLLGAESQVWLQTHFAKTRKPGWHRLYVRLLYQSQEK